LLGDVAKARGEFARAEEMLDESVASARAVGRDPALIMALRSLANCVRERGDHRQAATLLVECAEIARRGRDPVLVQSSIAELAALAAAAGRAEEAIRLFGASDAWTERFGFVPSPADRSWLERVIAPARVRLDEAAFRVAWTAGRALSLEQAIAEALAVAEAIQREPALDDRAAPPTSPAAAYGLTARELEVWRLIAEGRSNQEVADALFMSPRTAQTHTTRLLAKLGVPSRNAATALAHRLGVC
jgi:non-specific serine/threonine protein kinase